CVPSSYLRPEPPAHPVALLRAACIGSGRHRRFPANPRDRPPSARSKAPMTSQPHQTPAHRTPRGLVVLLGWRAAVAALAIDMYLPSLPAMGAELKATPGETQWTVAAFLAGMAFGQLLYGPASDRLGRRPPILLGLTIYVAASALCALAQSAP